METTSKLPPPAVMLLTELLEMFDSKGCFMTGNRPGDFTKWLTKAREQMGSNIPLQVAQDVLLEAEQAIRNLGDCGGGRSLALFIMAIADDGRRFRVSDLSTLDVGMSSLAARLFHEFMVGKRDHDEWQSLAELAQRVVFPDEKLPWLS